MYVSIGVYKLLLDSCGEETPVPEHYGENVNLDPLDYYYMLTEWSFMETEGTEGTVIQQYQVYKRNYEDKMLEECGFTGINLGYWLIYDVTGGKWYKLTLDDYYIDFDDITSIGVWEEILNNVA